MEKTVTEKECLRERKDCKGEISLQEMDWQGAHVPWNREHSWRIC